MTAIIPPNRIPLRLARGDYSELETARNVGELREGEFCYARDQDALYVLENVGGALKLIQIGGTSAPAEVTNVPPVPAVEGQEYFNPQSNQLFVSVKDPAAPSGFSWSQSGGGARVIVSRTQPPVPDVFHAGSLWFDTGRNELFVAIENPPGSGSVMWDLATGGTSTGNVIIAPFVPPGTHSPGTFWFDSANGELYIWYDDSNTAQWVSANAIGGHGSAIHQVPVFVGDQPPTAPQEGDLWFSATKATLYVYYDQGGTSNWVQAVPMLQAPVQSAMAYCGDTAPANPLAGGLWWNTLTGVMYVYYDDGVNPGSWVAANPLVQGGVGGLGGAGGAAGAGAVGVTQNVTVGLPPNEVTLQIANGVIVNVIT